MARVGGDSTVDGHLELIGELRRRIERLFGAERADGRHVTPCLRRGSNRGINLVRYADDFVVTAPSREVLEAYVLPRLTEFLAGRGLELSEAKTRTVHIDDGFDFLGFNLRHFPNGKLLARPQKEKVALHHRRLSTFFRGNRQMPTAEVIKQLSPVIRGWCNYYRYAVAKRTFAVLDHHIWRITYKWAKRRHPRKNRRWVVNHYYGVDQGRGWDLWDGRNRLPRHNETRVSRFVKVRGKASPFDPSLRAYWEDRRTRRLMREASHFHRIHLLQRQAGRCAACKAVFDPELERGANTNVAARGGRATEGTGRRTLCWRESAASHRSRAGRAPRRAQGLEKGRGGRRAQACHDPLLNLDRRDDIPLGPAGQDGYDLTVKLQSPSAAAISSARVPSTLVR